MSKFKIGHRYMSLAEPEFGLGTIVAVLDKKVEIHFAASSVTRVYGDKTAPLKRVIFETGDEIKTKEGSTYKVSRVDTVGDKVVYHCENDLTVDEEALDDHLSFSRPEEKLYNNMIDSDEFFNLRLKTLELKKKWDTSQVKGLFGGRVSLLPHQLYIASTLLKSHHPRVLLADEVGLGKTIEAGLAIHALVTSARVQRVLIVVPEALTYQWFFEMHRKFQLGFVAINQETPPEPGVNPFLEHERVIVSAQLLKGSQMAQDFLSQADFDLLVVDEAHQYYRGKPEYSLLEDLCLKIPSVLLLTATPEQLGLQGHFDRLRLLDSDRYFDFDKFQKEMMSYQEVAEQARALQEKGQRQKVLELVDRHGTGRSFFRNTRSRMSKEYNFFPRRVLNKYDLENKGLAFQEKLVWLANFLQSFEHKVLLICHRKEDVLRLERSLTTMVSGIKLGVFHSGQSLMARDRQAAYFADPVGAQILLCTEIGAEGRNFEFASHLILFDLPKKPDLLEQRIGRLDRIGQKGNVNIHVPVISGTEEEVLFNLYDQGLESFKRFSSCGTHVFKKFSQEIEDAYVSGSCEHFLNELISYRISRERSEEEGRDVLIEINSFNADVGQKIIQDIKEREESYELEAYMESVFQCFGVDSEELNSHATFIKPSDNMFLPHFPCLEREGMSITYHRREAIDREDYTFLNWDHLMVRDIMNIILSENYGNLTVAMRKEKKGKKSFIEAFYSLECIAPGEYDVKRFFPNTLVRVLIDKDGNDFSEKWSQDFLSDKITWADKESQHRAMNIPKELMKSLLEKSLNCAQEKSEILKSKLIEEANEKLNAEINRLEALAKVNENVSVAEVEFIKSLRRDILGFGRDMRLSLSALRIIL